MNINYPVSYCCSYRLGSGETVEDILLCCDFAAAFDKAKDDVKNKMWCESVFFFDPYMEYKFTLDNFEGRSGVFEVSENIFGTTQRRHITDFCSIPLGEIDHHNRRVFLACYKELKALWDNVSDLENDLLRLVESRYDTYDDFMAKHCKFDDEQALIIAQHYGEYAYVIINSITEHRMLWRERYIDDKLKQKGLKKSYKSKSIPIGRDNSEVPF